MQQHPGVGSMSRLIREVWACSTKLANPIGAMQLYICHYNLTRATA